MVRSATPCVICAEGYAYLLSLAEIVAWSLDFDETATSLGEVPQAEQSENTVNHKTADLIPTKETYKRSGTPPMR